MIPNRWYAVLESSKLRAKPVAIERLEQKLVLWRDAKGKVVIQTDRCIHKGAQLSLGKVLDGCLECPYHGLRFDPKGDCVLVPFKDRDSKIPEGWHIESHNCREEKGLIWMWYGEEKPEGDVPWFDNFPSTLQKTWQAGTIWPYHYSRLMDSNFDVYHLPFVHHSFFPKVGPVVTDYQVEDHGDLIKTITTLDEYESQRKGDKGKKTFVVDVMMPNLLYLEMSAKLSLLAIVTPIDDQRSWVFARYHAAVPFGGLAAWVVGRFEYSIFQKQDKRILDTLPKGPLQPGEYHYGSVDKGSILWLKKRDAALKEYNGESET